MSVSSVMSAGGDSSVTGVSDLDELTRDVSLYLCVDSKKERQAFTDSIEEMLTKLDEFGGLVDMIRSDTKQCIDETVPLIQSKCEEVQLIFNRIDKLEAFVSIVRQNVTMMEELVSKAENDMGSFSGIKKILSFVGMAKPSASRDPVFTPPDIFRTEKYLGAPSQSTPRTQPESVRQPDPTPQPDLVKQPDTTPQPDPVKQPDPVAQPDIPKEEKKTGEGQSENSESVIDKT